MDYFDRIADLKRLLSEAIKRDWHAFHEARKGKEGEVEILFPDTSELYSEIMDALGE